MRKPIISFYFAMDQMTRMANVAHYHGINFPLWEHSMHFRSSYFRSTEKNLEL